MFFLSQHKFHTKKKFLLGSERLDYVVDYEDITTTSKTISLEWFHIEGDGTYLVTANEGNFSHVFAWNKIERRWDEHQKLFTNLAACFKYFKIGNRVSWFNMYSKRKYKIIFNIYLTILTYI